MPTTAPSFVVTQVVRNRTITLYDRALPYRPFSLKGTQRVELTWLAGYAEATATVLGPAIEPTTITGMWKVKYLNDTRLPAMVEDNGVAVYSMDDTIEAFNTIRREGLLLRVAWGTVVRKGFLKSFEVSYLDLEDATWTMEFVWINEGEETVPVVVPQPSSTQGAANQYRQQLEQTATAAEAAPYGQSFRQREITERILDSIESSVQAANTVLALQFGIAIKPLDATRRMLAVAVSVVAQNDTLIARYSDQVPGASSLTPLPLQTAPQRLAAQVNSRAVIKLSRTMRQTAIEQQLALSTQTTSQILALYVGRDGDDLRHLAVRYYGNELEWRRLLTFNQLSSSLLVAGQIVLIPKTSELNADQVA